MTMTRRMHRSVLFLALLVILAAFGPAQAAQQIRWRSGTVATVPKTPTELREAITILAADPDARHIVVQFSEPVGPQQRADLGAKGVRLLSYLGDNAFIARLSPSQVDTEAVVQTSSLIEVQAIDPVRKLHPFLAAGKTPIWAVVSPLEPMPKPQPTVVGAYVLFHPDVSLEPEGVAAVARHGATVRSVLESINGLVIELPLDNIPAVAREDVVQWIEPPLPRFIELNDSNRQITEADVVQDPPYELDGSGVSVLVYDGGYAYAGHQDFGGRLTVRDTSGTSDHATHVSGTVGGSGAAGGGQYRGMAPGVIIESYGFEQEGGLQEGFLYSDPGDLEDDYGEAINTYGVDIANNSIGTNTATNGFPCEWTGDYNVTSNLIDSIVTGALGEPFRIVWANGNERQTVRCGNLFHTTAPPACAKNHITVGAMNSNDDSVTSFTSWGPCDDGRIKPDISGPGCQSGGDGGVTSCSSSGGYGVKCGTSMSSPTICGLSALLLEDFRNQFPDKPDFLNSTLKALLAHNAEDIENVGPDFKTGYGSVRIQQTVDFMRTENFLEAEVDLFGMYSVLVIVEPSDLEFKATLAWDDAPGALLIDPALVNDLDLVVYDPSDNRRYPWTLDPDDPDAPAVQTHADHVNNIEQVFVGDPTPGVWRVEVHGFVVPQGPQVFSLCLSPTMINCSTQGAISFNDPKYACESSAGIQVVDCDLNTDNDVTDTVTVTIASDTEPAGEMILLTESNPASASFDGAIPLSTTDAEDILQVSEGDTVTVTYIDEDDGFGGTNVVVEATAPVDCMPPVVSNVQTVDIGPYDATVTFDTDEPTLATVRYGTSCGSLTETAIAVGYQTAHGIQVTGLTEIATYFLAIDVVDEAGNAATDDNGGMCYSFTTPDVPNFFTEEFGSDHDLDYLSLIFTPNGSYDQYAACVQEITGFPTDPTGGTVLSFSPDMDNGYTLVNLSGGATVLLYDTSYTSFYVGSNGYITFGAGDSRHNESLADHFSMPRVSGAFDDLNPEAGGKVSWIQLADRAVVTWEDVPEWWTTNSNSFQIEMHFDGTITLNYLSIAAGDSIAGLSAGNGLPTEFYETDLSAMAPCGAHPPEAENANAFTVEDIPVSITLVASDDGLPEPPALAYIIASLPGNGSLSDPNGGAIDSVPYELLNHGNVVLYTPAADFSGSDNFQFKANDGGTAPGGGHSNIATVSIGVAPDCNENEIADNEDIADCEGETWCDDCNTNGVPDGCDVTSGTSVDCDGNGIPDECVPPDCDDDDVCTEDWCEPGTGCVHGPIDCDDEDECTYDWCDLATGCVHDYYAREYGDIYPLPGGDGAVEGFDILCVLDQANDVSRPDCMSGDIYPCDGGDGAVEGYDILAVLDAAEFTVENWCDDPCP